MYNHSFEDVWLVSWVDASDSSREFISGPKAYICNISAEAALVEMANFMYPSG